MIWNSLRHVRERSTALYTGDVEHHDHRGHCGVHCIALLRRNLSTRAVGTRGATRSCPARSLEEARSGVFVAIAVMRRFEPILRVSCCLAHSEMGCRPPALMLELEEGGTENYTD